MAMRKEPNMKPMILMGSLALATALWACNTGDPTVGFRYPENGGGGTGGTGNVGGSTGDGFCTTEENQAVYDNLTYTDRLGETSEGDEAASAIGSHCIGLAPTEANLPDGVEDCLPEAGAVLDCAPACSNDVILALADCVATCTQNATAALSPPGLDDNCVSCTGDTVACGAASCVRECSGDTDAPACIQCRCDNNCIQEFDACSGLPSGGECG
ncbi:MAG: hypothetical protein AMJ62_05675 [Myxococcales bacterium SG8_38]|nr:MAG: hypothetical protein AMJ62_05675 [Myxococcales bacterium SG8_38]